MRKRSFDITPGRRRHRHPRAQAAATLWSAEDWVTTNAWQPPPASILAACVWDLLMSVVRVTWAGARSSVRRWERRVERAQ